MIAQLTGSVIDVRLNRLVVNVSGLGYEVIVAPELASETKIGDLLTLHTSLVVREDAWTLYGFSSTDAKTLFEELQSVTGIGPKVASALLAVYSPEELKSAIASQDNAALERVPGIGKKVASGSSNNLAGSGTANQGYAGGNGNTPDNTSGSGGGVS